MNYTFEIFKEWEKGYFFAGFDISISHWLIIVGIGEFKTCLIC